MTKLLKQSLNVDVYVVRDLCRSRHAAPSRRGGGSEGFASAASSFHSREGWSECCLEDLWGSLEVSGCLFVFVWASLGAPGVPLGFPWGSLGDPWGSFGVLGRPLGVPWGSLGGPLKRLGCEGMRWDTKMLPLLSKNKVLGITGFQHVTFA